MINIKRLGHVALSVPDVKETADFYEKILGMEISDRVGEAVFCAVTMITIVSHYIQAKREDYITLGWK